MNLVENRLINEQEARKVVAELEQRICRTLEGQRLSAECVIAACDRLSARLNEAEHLPALMALGMPEEKARRELAMAKMMTSRPYLERRLALELGEDYDHAVAFTPYAHSSAVKQMWRPLGTLLHIAAGNVDALPVFSVIEGLLTGNMNILKLPGLDDGLSIPLLMALTDEEPRLADYIYVFDFPSEDLPAMQAMANVADAVVVWGGDAAVSAVRALATPHTKIIEWGHKISFAYAGGKITDDELEDLAWHICDTNQLFCNSCQGIYLDTQDYDELLTFAARFCAVLDRAAQAAPLGDHLYLPAQKTLEHYTETLESVDGEKQVFQTPRCGVIACRNSMLAPSYMYRSCWVRPLPRNEMVKTLHPHKSHLQTVALLGDEREANIELFSRLGVVRITGGRGMSDHYCGLPHDGEFALQRYVKRFSVESV